MENLQKQLLLLSKELGNSKTSKERVTEIKEVSLKIAQEIDKGLQVPFAFEMVKNKYQNESKYPRRRVKAVLNMLLEYVS